MTAKAEEQFKRLENRVAYIGKKVGDELTDLLTARILEEHGIPLGEIKRVVQMLPAPEPITDAEKSRLTHARSRLREAAQSARNVDPAGSDLDKATNQGWLYMQMDRLIAEVFTFDVYKDYGDHFEGRRRKLEQHHEKEDGKASLQAKAEYFEDLAERLNVDEIDPKTTLPATFAEFCKGR